MSFDLAVWKSESVPSDCEAGEVYRVLRNNECGGGPVEPGVGEFYADLTVRYPEIDKVPEEAVDEWAKAFLVASKIDWQT